MGIHLIFCNVLDIKEITDFSIHDLKTLLTLGNSEAIALAVQEGLGVAFVSNAVVAGMRQPDISIVPVHGLTICRDIYIGRHVGRPATVAQTVFWDMIQNLDAGAICGPGSETLVFRG